MEKNIKNALTEELQRYRQICEYTFIGEEPKSDNADDKDLLLGFADANLTEEEPETESELEDVDTPPMDDEDTDNIPPMNDVETDFPEEESELDDTNVPSMDDIEMDFNDPMGDEVEIDVTELVKKTEEANQNAMLSTQKMEELMGQFNMLSDKLNKLDQLDIKIDDLEKEVVERSPTEVEKLEMRSLDSFPYNLKLTDFWSEKEATGDIQATDTPIEDADDKPEEFELTQDDVDSDYNRQFIKKSFNI